MIKPYRISETRSGESTISISCLLNVSELSLPLRPWVEDANATSPAFSRIFKEMILITHHDKPMKRTAKGSVQRKVALKDYEYEIDAL